MITRTKELIKNINLELALSYGICLSIFLAPIKLSICYITLIPCLLTFSITNSKVITDFFKSKLGQVCTIFLCSIMISCLFNLSAPQTLLKSNLKFIKLAVMFICIPMFAWNVKKIGQQSMILALLTGQSIAALHSINTYFFPNFLPNLFVGTIAESGQLALVIPLIVAFIHEQHLTKKIEINKIYFSLAPLFLITCALIFNNFYLSILTSSFLSIYLIINISALIFKKQGQTISNLLIFGLTLICFALILNLKRGPYLGVIVGLGVFYLIFSRKLMLLMISISIGAATIITPLKERILDSYQHFAISGGRSEIWSIGLELIRNHPLGVGYENSSILHKYSLEIPPELKHFHNNLLNISAELGWLGLACFLWLLFLLITQTYKSKKYYPLNLGLACALIAQQTAGIVEYNFGDSEVMIIFLFISGLIYNFNSQTEI